MSFKNSFFLVALITSLCFFSPANAQEKTKPAAKKVEQKQETDVEKAEDKKKPEDKAKVEEKPAKKKAPAKPKIVPSLSKEIADQIKWRSIGPANMGGRITSIAVYEKDPCKWWAATASGGLLKTTNNGVTFEHQFDDQDTVSIGDVQVSQSNPDIVWVGTGESNPRNSVSWGDGVYKSLDGGKTWKNMGLKKSFQTGALAIHPENPDVVWVGSLGRLWGPNKERGLFKTTDGGKTWRKVLYINDKTGIIDVQLNPGNPDEMLIATYERKRDGFDGNDPMQRFGAGSGIYKSTDGGESFERISEGLPTCKLGRIGLDYHEADPKVVVAIIESEKIAKEPENYSYLGIRGENADVGARLVSVTAGGPADKSGLKNDDIVVSVNDKIVASYSEFLLETHKKLAGETIKVVVSRDRKLIDIDLKLGKRPGNGTPRRRTDFTGTLGGQSANRQDTQGPDGHEYGGIYLSEDGGSSWKRINSLNPRPMYYSNIQIDPVDRNNIYVCGTSLYKSSDGGKTFTGDGGTDGIHVDHHALWIDKRDPRHMILGNDGGIYITHDRMEHWDHHNHVAIGQFYHVGVDSNLDYKVYGGLQDNGSWGGPSRSESGSGPVNTDWYRVGGGDGFVTLADPDDPNQIYFESQNGGMGRIHLETGARGFIRPRERGVRFRFNWKTPFILSPHNSKIHYSAGNYVLRSFNKGDGIKRISPEITNTDKGAGSAISESAAETGVIYVGTTDGAVWVTKNGGSDWEPLFFSPPKKSDKDGDKDSDEKKPANESKDKPKTKDESKTKNQESPESDDSDPITGSWSGRYLDDRIPEDRANFDFKLKLSDGKLTGEIDGRRGTSTITGGTFDPETGKISWEIESERGSRAYSGTFKENTMTGTMVVGDGRFEMDFEASKTKKDPNAEKSGGSASASQIPTLRTALTGSLRAPKPNDDPVTGSWKAYLESENVPGGRLDFTINLKMNEKKSISGGVSSVMGDLDIVSGTFDEEKNRLVFEAENDDLAIECKCNFNGNEMNGILAVNDGEMEVDFVANREDDAKTAEVETADANTEKPSQPDMAEKKADAETPKDKDAKTETETEKEETVEKKESADLDDAISGKWAGTMTSARGERELTVVLKRKSDTEITGTFESSNGERDISSGTFDPDSGTLTLISETEQFQLQLSGPVKESTYSGEIDVNEGQFTMEFSLKRQGKEEAAKDDEKEKSKQVETKENANVKKAPTGDKSLAKWMPGPRWVSSLHASKFKAGRCYISLDGHRSDDDGVYLFVTNDYGQTWESLKNNLPDNAGSVRVIREDIKNENLLFLGCEFSSWYSIDAGASWTKFAGGFPTVSVHEFAIHPTAGEIVAGTHGRSLWVADISILRQLSKTSLSEPVKLYQPKDAIRWQSKPARGAAGTRVFTGKNPTRGTVVAYSLGKNARSVELEVVDLNGDTVKEFEASRRKGLHVFQWDLRRDLAEGARFAQSVGKGTYQLRLKVDGEIKRAT
jgi:photosystem II stability/assembly factor-like uncharacterized protein